RGAEPNRNPAVPPRPCPPRHPPAAWSKRGSDGTRRKQLLKVLTRRGQRRARNPAAAKGSEMGAPPRQWLKIEQAGEVTIARFIAANLLDEQIIEAIGERLYALADVPGRPLIVLDMRTI